MCFRLAAPAAFLIFCFAARRCLSVATTHLLVVQLHTFSVIVRGGRVQLPARPISLFHLLAEIQRFRILVRHTGGFSEIIDYILIRRRIIPTHGLLADIGILPSRIYIASG